ncbi:MAG: 4-(cytidine 5'-diphospho)-2-C-methyl-D-erythritol kinase [Lachnospiraceae bacterium]|nr:4-(cytidine 5'-diphospho)-2-C-methyl-D-erythritol kinase [Lachnospiraceae bacterium]
MVLKYKAYAKVNIGLDVLRRREDGYHDVKMVMQTVNLFDELTMEDMSSNGIIISTNDDFIPTNEDNLIYKAAKLLMDEFHIEKGVKIDLVKNIPVAAGMAGGSTDAAATMIGINELFSLGLSKEDLMKRAVKIGADVPYCVMGGTALSEGIGEVLTPIKGMPQCLILIAKPEINVSTKFVYENLHANELKNHPDIDGLVDFIKNSDLAGIASKMENVLETVTAKEYPIIEDIKKYMKENGALNSIMSGSGPTVFGLFDDKEIAEKAYKGLVEKNITRQVFLTDLFL